MSETSSLLSSSNRGSGYESDGETNTMSTAASEGGLSSPECVHGVSEGGNARQRRTAGREEEEGSDPVPEMTNNQECGLVYCYKKILNALPAIGDDSDGDISNEANEAAFKFGAQQIVMLIVPVTICMALVVAIQLLITIKGGNSQPQQSFLLYAPFSENNDNSGIVLLAALGNVVIIIVLVVVMTVILVLLFKYRCYLIIRIWLIVASAMLLFFFSSYLFVEALQVHNLAIDWISFIFLVWNYGVMGVVVIHWKGPLRLQQAYLIMTSTLAAYIFVKYLPDWTTWLLLFAISVYDIVAVLCPKGPLRILVETARERNENIFPALIYSSTMIIPLVGMADRPPADNNGSPGNNEEEDHQQQQEEEQEEARELAVMQSSLAPDEVRQRQSSGQQQQQQESEEEEEPRGFKLGLGDFIFYSILVGKAAHDSYGDWVIISACFVAILIGLCMTTLILGIVRRALPALPISITFGLIFYFATRFLISPFATVLSTTQTFI